MIVSSAIRPAGRADTRTQRPRPPSSVLVEHRLDRTTFTSCRSSCAPATTEPTDSDRSKTTTESSARDAGHAPETFM